MKNDKSKLYNKIQETTHPGILYIKRKFRQSRESITSSNVIKSNRKRNDVYRSNGIVKNKQTATIEVNINAKHKTARTYHHA